MTTLTEVHSFLAASLRDDPLLCLAQVVARFDPLWNGLPDDEFNDDGSLAAALDVTRDVFPDIYALAVDALHHSAGYDDLDTLICAEISARGIPLDCIETVGYGIPLPAYGTLLHDPDFYTYHPDVVPVMQLFGIQPEEDNPIDIPDHACSAAQIIADDLAEHASAYYRQVSWLIQWLFGFSNNSVVDWDTEMMFSVEPLLWDAENIAFAIEIIEEADTIMREVSAGLQWLITQPTVMQAMQDNIQRLYRSSARQSKSRKERKHYDHPRLHWPALDSGLTGTTESDP
ncbi:MAG: hypothetical protein KJ047_05390 [Anaerolineae bacterium]|nr:hypothetical protein [Anaerolineae bacterium]